jgi:SNF2 family DNA or RNA helicase
VEAARDVALGLGWSAEVIHGGTSRAERGRIIEQFKAGKLDVLCGSLETIAEGLTLTAADMVIFLETSFKPSRNQQAMRRIHRLGQEYPCTALDYITPDTVDEGKRELLKAKTDQQIRVLTAAQMAAIC